MQFTLVVIACLQALALAHPHARSDEYDLILPRVNQNGTNVTDHTDQDVPSFKEKCVCPTPICDSRMNEKSVSIQPPRHRQSMLQESRSDDAAKQICQCKASAAQACFLKSQGGCPEPKLKVSAYIPCCR